MKKTLLIILLACISCSENQSNDLKEYNLKGDVISVKSKKYRAIEKFGEVEKGEVASRNDDYRLDADFANVHHIFNDQGRIISTTLFDKNGDIDVKITIEDTIANFYSPGGRLMIRAISDDYDLPKEINVYDFDGDLRSKVLSTYDEKQNPLETKEYDESGALMSQSTYTYNENDLIKNEEIMKVENKRVGYSRRKTKDTINSIFTYTYNAHNDVAEITLERENKELSKTYTYTYDDQDNWIQRIEHIGLQPKFIIERTIKYK